MVRGLTAPLSEEERGSFRILNQYGLPITSVAADHEAARTVCQLQVIFLCSLCEC